MKLLLYCVKAKPYLSLVGKYDSGKNYYEAINDATIFDDKLNGKIVAECDFEVEEIEYYKDYNGWLWYSTKSLWENRLLCLSCLSANDIENYLGDTGGYAIHIKNLHIFDKPKELNEVYKIENIGGMLFTKQLTNAPQNMMRVSVNHWDYATCEPKDINVLISIKPEWLCKILNGEKFVEVRKKVLKEMITSGNNQ